MKAEHLQFHKEQEKSCLNILGAGDVSKKSSLESLYGPVPMYRYI